MLRVEIIAEQDGMTITVAVEGNTALADQSATEAARDALRRASVAVDAAIAPMHHKPPAVLS